LIEIYSKTPDLPEDAMTQSFQALAITSNQILAFDWSISNPTIPLKRSARIILLIVFLSHRHSVVKLTPNPMFDGASTVVQSTREKEIGFEELLNGQDDSLEEEFHQKTHIDELVGSDIEVGDDVKALKSKIKELSKVSTFKLEPGKTVLVFDTNVVLRDLQLIRSLMESMAFPIILPLVVISELDGLCQNERLGASALEALQYLRSKVGKSFQLQTSRGTILSTLAFYSEEWSDKFSTADDVILDACRQHPAVCLITDDINLRLKARTVKVPVLDSIKKLL
jgi:rRNA-processing protein FCF1